MDYLTTNDASGVSRRGFLLGAATGLAAGVPLTWLGLRALRPRGPRGEPLFTGHPVEVSKPAYGMPGPFPGRVVEVHHPGAVDANHHIDAGAVNVMMDRGMKELTGATDAVEAWRRFFEKGDVVGIKVNPVGRKPKPGESGRVANAVGSISSPAVVRAIVNGLIDGAGVRPKDIWLFERYAREFIEAGYDQEFKDLWQRGVRWWASLDRLNRTRRTRIERILAGLIREDPLDPRPPRSIRAA